VFVQARARHYADTGKAIRAARDYALAHTLFPNSRKIYVGLAGNLVAAGERLFAPNEHGHPASLGAYLAGRYLSPGTRTGAAGSGRTARPDPLAELERVTELNRRNMQRLRRQPTRPQPYRPALPGAVQPHQSQPRR